MPTIKVPRTFYVKERMQVYSPWQSAFWRELIQNSVDAGATSIDIGMQVSAEKFTVEHPWQPGTFLDPKPMTLVTFSDNGPGMDKKTLEDVYMTLGASQKGAGAAGGFGRARILTCFSHPSWLLSSQDWSAQSMDEGTGYEVKKARHKQDGLIVQVLIEETLSDLEDALWKIVNQCQLPSVEFKINGTSMCEDKRFAPTDRGTKIKTLIKGQATVYEANGGDCTNHILVRVNGLIMFDTYLYSSKEMKGYVIELEPATSRNLMSASRDSAKGLLKEKIETLMAELNRGNTDAAYDQVVVPCLIRYGEGGPRSHKVGMGAGYKMPPHMLNRQFRQTGQTKRKLSVSKESAREIISALFTARKEERTVIIQKALKEREPVTLYLEGSSVFMKVDANQKKWIDAAEAWAPTSWRHIITPDGHVGWFPEHKVMAEQLKAWSLICEAGSAILTLLTRQSYFFYPGIIVSPTARGMCLTESHQDGVPIRVLMFNPLIEEGDKFSNYFDIRTNDGLRELVAVGLHEVAHMAVSHHNEAYAKVLTDMIMILNIEELMTAVRNRL